MIIVILIALDWVFSRWICIVHREFSALYSRHYTSWHAYFIHEHKQAVVMPNGMVSAHGATCNIQTWNFKVKNAITTDIEILLCSKKLLIIVCLESFFIESPCRYLMRFKGRFGLSKHIETYRNNWRINLFYLSHLWLVSFKRFA